MRRRTRSAVGLVRGGAGTALVGSHQEVTDLIFEYHSLGFDEFILSGHPHLEEAHWFAEASFRYCGRRVSRSPIDPCS